jgi:phosphohistidine phosphatase
MQLILFRHGPAGRPDPARWPDDRARPLTPRGEEKTRAAARGLARLLPSGATIWTSPFVRATRTAELLAAALDGAPPHTVPALASGGPARAVLQLLATESPDGTIVLVGHEPDLGLLAGSLLLESTGALPLKKAGACALSFDGPPRKHDGALDWFLPPRLLRALGARKRAGEGAT